MITVHEVRYVFYVRYVFHERYVCIVNVGNQLTVWNVLTLQINLSSELVTWRADELSLGCDMVYVRGCLWYCEVKW